MTVTLHLEDCRETMRAMEPNSVDSIVTDPPYGLSTGLDAFAMVRSWLATELFHECYAKLEALGWSRTDAQAFANDLHPREEYKHNTAGFMGSRWDSIVPGPSYWREAFRVLKPGGHVLAFGATRTWHWLACALELSGFESRGSIAWIQGEGMQHGLDLGIAMDAAAGAKREVVGKHPCPAGNGAGTIALGGGWQDTPDLTAPATPEAQIWDGWGTQLAPKHEPVCMFRKPMEGTTVQNVLEHGTGALNVDACRLGGEPWKGPAVPGKRPSHFMDVGSGIGDPVPNGTPHELGRWPPNVALDEAAATELDSMVGKRTSGALRATTPQSSNDRTHGAKAAAEGRRDIKASSNGPSAFFYCPKATTRERDQGCEHLRWTKDGGTIRPWNPGDQPLWSNGKAILNPWPTVKPLALIRWLMRLVTPPGGRVLDLFMGSGTGPVAAVCEGFDVVGCDLDPVAHTIAQARVAWARGLGPSVHDLPAGMQGSLWS